MEIVFALVVLGAVVAAFARRLSVPPPSLLVVAGVLVGLIPGVPAARPAPDAVSFVVLPPLIYAAAHELSWRELRAVWRPVSVLAIGLVVASAAAVAAVATVITPLTAAMAVVLGAILASTDPVAAAALGRQLALPPRLGALVSAESLVNDATSLVLFRVTLGVALGSEPFAWGSASSWGDVLAAFARLGLGGAALGAVAGAVLVPVRRRTDDPVLETVIALITPYACFVLAERLHTSGVAAVVAAAIVLGARGEHITSAGGRLRLEAVYGTVVFLLESAVFALIGLELPTLVRDLNARDAAWPAAALALAATLLAVRALWVFPLAALVERRRGARQAEPAAPATPTAPAAPAAPAPPAPPAPPAAIHSPTAISSPSGGS